MKRAFLVSKPLQLMIAGNIKDQYFSGEYNILVIWDGFLGSEDVASRGSDLKDLGWSAVYYFVNKKSALSWLKQQSLGEVLFDSDVGLANSLSLLSLKARNFSLKVSVFEEGVGTYRSDLYQGAKKGLFKVLGVGSVFGGSCFTSEIFVYNPDHYTSTTGNYATKASLISGGLDEYIESNLSTLSSLFSFVPYGLEKSTKAVLFLSDFELNERELDDSICSMLLSAEVAILKPHPHIRTVKSTVESIFDYQCLAAVPSELLIKSLSAVCSQVTVLHYGSSTESYAHFENVWYLDISRPKHGT